MYIQTQEVIKLKNIMEYLLSTSWPRPLFCSAVLRANKQMREVLNGLWGRRLCVCGGVGGSVLWGVGGVDVVVCLVRGYLAWLDRQSWKARVVVCWHGLLGRMAPHPAITTLPFVCLRNICATPRLNDETHPSNQVQLATHSVLPALCTAHMVHAALYCHLAAWQDSNTWTTSVP